MRRQATLKLETGENIPVELDTEDPVRQEIVVRRSDDAAGYAGDLLTAIDEHLGSAVAHAGGTAERLLAADRDRPY